MNPRSCHPAPPPSPSLPSSRPRGPGAVSSPGEITRDAQRPQSSGRASDHGARPEYVALLRAVNVGGGIVNKEVLRRPFTRAGGTNVRT